MDGGESIRAAGGAETAGAVPAPDSTRPPPDDDAVTKPAQRFSDEATRARPGETAAAVAERVSRFTEDPAGGDVPRGGDETPTPRRPPGDYPRVPFDVDEDVRREVLRSCVKRIQDDFYVGRAHGVDLVIDKNTAYYNASHLVPDDGDMNTLMEGDAMKAVFDYVQNRLGRRPFYQVVGHVENRSLNGTYMHGVTVGNVLGFALRKNDPGPSIDDEAAADSAFRGHRPDGPGCRFAERDGRTTRRGDVGEEEEDEDDDDDVLSK